MTRDIKFRAWDKHHREWCGADVQLLRFDGNLVLMTLTEQGELVNPTVWSDDSRFVVMQYTGLKDKNGVEIYEGDIVRCEAGTGVVEFKYGGLFIVDWREAAYNKCLDSWVDGGSFSGVVIGNIYENPDLLKS